MSTLTAAESQFCALLVKGVTQLEAYRRAWPKSRAWKDTTVSPKASRLLAQDKIRARIEELRGRAAEKAGLTVDEHMRTLADLRDEARGAGAFAPAVTAEVARGKAAGLYEQRATVTVKGLDWKALLGGPGSAADDDTEDPAT